MDDFNDFLQHQRESITEWIHRLDAIDVKKLAADDLRKLEEARRGIPLPRPRSGSKTS